jgi:molybdopterin-binding protein
MRLSARNNVPGTVRSVVRGPVTSEVSLEIAPGIEIVATISTRSADVLGLTVGKRAYAIIKASHVIMATDD